MYNKHLSDCGRAKDIQLPNIWLVKYPSKLLFGTDMFKFETCFSLTHIYKDVSVQKLNFKFKST